MHLAPPCASGSVHPVDIHLCAQVGLVCALCVHVWVCMHTHVPHCARTPRKPHRGKRHRARAAGGWRIQRVRRREGEVTLRNHPTGPNPDPVETFGTQNGPHRGCARTHRCAHAHTGGHTHSQARTHGRGRGGPVAAGRLARRPGLPRPRCDVTARPPAGAPSASPRALRAGTSVLSGIS